MAKPPTPQPQSARAVEQLSGIFERQIRLVNTPLEPPKRTTSLGPRRSPAFGGAIPPSDQSQPKPEAPRAESRFNRMAAELQSSLTDLNRLIEETSPTIGQARLSNNKSPILTEGTKSIADRRASFGRESNLSRPIERTSGWDPENDLREMASSVTDLRSMFESSQNQSLVSRPPKVARPPSNVPVPNLSSNTASKFYSDYTIRRTTSTSTPKTCTVRNPYRTHYGLL